MADVLEEARPVFAALPDDVVDGDSAIHAQCVGTWTAARDLAAQYARARAIQNGIVSAAGKNPDQAILARVYGYVKNPDQHGDVRGFVISENTPRQANELTGEPIDPPMLPWLDSDDVAALRYVLRDDVEWWVPTMQELRGHRTEVNERTRPNESSPTTVAQIRDAWVEKGEWGPGERSLRLAGL